MFAAKPDNPAINKKLGFTLIELSIVLVIIGLIVGGVLSGRELIKAAQLRSDLRVIEQFDLAASTFKGKYNCIPGDCPNITRFFDGTIAGDGDGIVFIGTGWSNYDSTEALHFIDHLSAAGLIENPRYDGSGVTWFYTPGKGLIRMKSGNIGAVTGYDWQYGNGQSYWLGVIADQTGGFQGLDTVPAYTAIDAFYLDSKKDDGKPLTGLVQATLQDTFDGGGQNEPDGNAASGECISNAAGNPYATTDSAVNCTLRVRAGF